MTIAKQTHSRKAERRIEKMKQAIVECKQDKQAGSSFYVVICTQDGWETGRMIFQYLHEAVQFAIAWPK